MPTNTANQSRIATLSDKHCIFQCGDSLFSLPATSVREVTMTPQVVRVPLSHPALVGLGNIRSEFIPVIDLEPVVGDQARRKAGVSQVVVVASALGSWAIAIDRVVAIAAIETHVDAGLHTERGRSVLLGTASHSGHVISVLDTNALHRIAQQTFADHWDAVEQLSNSDTSETMPASELHAQ